MDEKIEQALSEIKEIIDEKKESARKSTCERLRILKDSYPTEIKEIEKRFWEIYEACKVDFFSEIRINGDEIMEHLENS